MANGKQTSNRRAADFSRQEIYEICSKYGSEMETSIRTLANDWDTSEGIIAKLQDKAVVQGIVSMEVAFGMRKTAMYNARRGAADWAEREVRQAFQKKFAGLSEEGYKLGDSQWQELQEERDRQIAERRITVGKNAEVSSLKKYDELFAKRMLFQFSKAEEIDIFITLVESRWPKSIYSTREFIALDVLEMLIERVIGNPEYVGDTRVLQYREVYITAKASNEEKAAFERGMNTRNVRKLESTSGKLEVFRKFIATGADKAKFFAENPWLTSKKFAECLKVSITTVDAATDQEVETCVKLVTTQNNSLEVETFFQNLISERRANEPVTYTQLNLFDD